MYRVILRRIRASVLKHWPIAALLLLFGGTYAPSMNSYGMLWWDECEYASIGRSIVDGEGFGFLGNPNPLRPPLLPLAGAACMLVSGDRFSDSVLKVASWAFDLLALLCVYGFAAAAFDRTVGIIAAFFLGISPFFWLFAPRFMCEVPFMTFFAAAVWFFHFGAYRHERLFVWSWICLALALMTRYTAVLFLPVLVVSIPVALWLGGPAVRRRFRTREFILSPLAGLVVILPWFIREWVVFGDPLVGMKQAAVQVQGYLPGVSMPRLFYLRQLPFMLSPTTALLFAAGVVWAFWTRERFALQAFLTAAVILAWFSYYRFKDDRLVSSALPFMAVVAAVPLAKLTAGLRSPLRAATLGVLLAGMFFLDFRATRPILKHVYTAGYPSFLEAMDFLRIQASPGALVMGSNFPQIHWYSGLQATGFPGDEKGLRESLRHSQWVVITNFEPGQPSYAGRLTDYFKEWRPTSATAALFQDRRWFTAVVRSDVMLQALAGKSPQP